VLTRSCIIVFLYDLRVKQGIIPENQTREEQDKAFLTLAHELRTNRRIIKGMTAGLDTNL